MSNVYFIFFIDSHRRVIIGNAIRVLVSLMKSTTDKVNYKTHHIIWYHIMKWDIIKLSVCQNKFDDMFLRKLLNFMYSCTCTLRMHLGKFISDFKMWRTHTGYVKFQISTCTDEIMIVYNTCTCICDWIIYNVMCKNVYFYKLKCLLFTHFIKSASLIKLEF